MAGGKLAAETACMVCLMVKRSLRPLKFHETKDVRYPYEAFVDDIKWTVRINEFPEDPSLYSLMIDGQVVEELMDWPAAWTKLIRGPDTPRRPVDPNDPAMRDEFEREDRFIEFGERVRQSRLNKK